LWRLVLRCITDEAFLFGKGDPGRCDSIALVVGDDFDFASTLNSTLRGAVSLFDQIMTMEYMLTLHKNKLFPDRCQ
jgi:hypothetical protein